MNIIEVIGEGSRIKNISRINLKGSEAMQKKVWLCFMVVILLAGCGPRQAEPADNILAVDAVQVDVSMIGPAPWISVTVLGTLPDDCTLWEKNEGAIQQRQEGNTFFIDITVTILDDAECSANPHPLELGIGLEYTSLPAGVYEVNVNGTSAQFEITPEQAFDQNTAEQIEAVVSAVRDDLAERFGAAEVDILGVDPMMWGDSCLHMPEPDEMCSDVIVPGYLVTAGDGEHTWEYHTNQDGSELRVLAP